MPISVHPIVALPSIFVAVPLGLPIEACALSTAAQESTFTEECLRDRHNVASDYPSKLSSCVICRSRTWRCGDFPMIVST